MTHKEILEHCIEMANKRRLAYLKASNPYKGTAEKLFRAKCDGIKYPDISDMANTTEELLNKYGNNDDYLSQVRRLFHHA